VVDHAFLSENANIYHLQIGRTVPAPLPEMLSLCVIILLDNVQLQILHYSHYLAILS